MKFVKIPTSSRDINDYIYSHLLPRNSVKSDLNGINYHAFILYALCVLYIVICLYCSSSIVWGIVVCL